MTKQETYEAIRTYFSRPEAVLAKENGRFVNGKFHPGDDRDDDFSRSPSVCFYRHPDDPSIRCAFGCILPDELYDPKMENKAAVDVLDEYPAVAALFSWDDKDYLDDFLTQVQVAHDDKADDAEEFVRLLDNIADSHGLEVK